MVLRLTVTQISENYFFSAMYLVIAFVSEAPEKLLSQLVLAPRHSTLVVILKGKQQTNNVSFFKHDKV